MTYTKDEIEEAIEVLLTGDYGYGSVCRSIDSLAWKALAAVWDVSEQCIRDIDETYAEAAGLLLEGWLPGEPLERL